MLTPTAAVKQVILTSLFNGKWISNTYELSNPDWREALKLFRDIGATVKIKYKS